MSITEYILKKPLILVVIFVICLGILLIIIGQQTLQEIVFIVFWLVIFLAFLFSALVTYFTYKKYARAYDILVVPLFFSVAFICFTAILMLLIFAFKSIYISTIESYLNLISFPLAIFGLGVSLYYFVEAQFSSEKKLDLILNNLNEIKDSKKNYSASDKEVIEPPLPNKDYAILSDEDKIIFNHLCDRHKNLLSYVDGVDTKFAQIIALNGLILSFIIFAAGNAKSFIIFSIGIILIVSSMIIGAYGYYTRNFYPGAAVKFFEDYDTFPKGIGIVKLKKQLLLDIERNEKKLDFKANIFNIMLPFVILGLIIIMVGYYA